MKVMMMTDLEGPSGINGRSDGIGNQTVNSPTACQMLLEEVNASVEGLVQGGADLVVVWDGHGGSNSIDIAKLHPKAQFATIGGDMAPCCFIDSSFDAAVQIGCHAMQGVADGYMSHTYNSHSTCNMWLNDKLVGEIAIQAYQAAYFGIPTILVSGDAAACREAKELLGDIPTVVTKKAVSRYTVINRNPAEVHEELISASKRAMQNLAACPVLKMPDYYQLKLQLMCPNFANTYEKMGIERLDQQTVLFKSNDFQDLWAQRAGWAPGVHNKKFGISKDWKGYDF